MEFSLLPIHRGEPPIPVPRTPYVSSERYDGGPWMSYPARKGRTLTAWNGTSFDLIEHYRSERANPTPLKDLEPFIQTWLYFGLLVEFSGINLSSLEEDSSVLTDSTSKDVVDRIYDTMLVHEGDKTYVSLDSDCLRSYVESTRPRLPKDPEIRKKYYHHLTLCLSCAHSLLSTMPKDFNHAVKYSIAALGELLMHTVNAGFQFLQIQPKFGRYWGNAFLNDEAKTSMRNHGWCVSDIARVEAKYKSIQALYMAQMMDRSLPSRDHSQCSEQVCKFYQIKMEDFQIRHQNEDCSCIPLEVNSENLTEILRKDDRFPLLRLTGDSHNLNIELVEYTPGLPYIAISHVWADGLGNPKSNSLHRCKLHHLRTLVAAVDQQETGEDTPRPVNPLIWLDTLCCPAQDGEGKQLAIEKIRLVYQQAKHVLVLDAGLMSYNARTQDVAEQLARIFMSGWMRRLWTLQEGALAKSLCFQFADIAVYLSELMETFGKRLNHMTYRAIFMDLWNEFQGLRTFFHGASGSMPYSWQSFATLDQSLLFRSVSVPSDEPLCIGTLMSLDLHQIVTVKPKSDRMRKVWELISSKEGGIPMAVVFFEEPKIDTPGWRWAPRSLLAWRTGAQVQLNTRILKWNSPLGTITTRGLRVQYPGFRIKTVKEYGDVKPQNPWPGFSRVPESDITFRDKGSGEWYRIIDKEYAHIHATSTKEERIAYQKLFPLHNVANTDNSVLLFNPVGEMLEGVFATVVGDGSSDSIEEGIAVKTEHIVMITAIRPDNGYVHDTIRELAIHLRADEVTDRHLEVYNRLVKEYRDSPDLLETVMENSEEIKSSLAELKRKMQHMVQEVAAGDKKFMAGMKSFEEVPLESAWVWIRDFFHHDYVGEKIGEGQVWFVD